MKPYYYSTNDTSFVLLLGAGGRKQYHAGAERHSGLSRFSSFPSTWKVTPLDGLMIPNLDEHEMSLLKLKAGGGGD